MPRAARRFSFNPLAHFANRMQIELTAALSQDDGLTFRSTPVSWHHCKPFLRYFTATLRSCAEQEPVPQHTPRHRFDSKHFPEPGVSHKTTVPTIREMSQSFSLFPIN